METKMRGVIIPMMPTIRNLVRRRLKELGSGRTKDCSSGISGRSYSRCNVPLIGIHTKSERAEAEG